MSSPKVDLTEAAKAYGLQTVPPINSMEDDDAAMLASFLFGDPEAAYDNVRREIDVWPDAFDPPNNYDQGRFAKVGVGPLDATGKAQFIIAHELWHAKQYELHGQQWLRNVAANTRDSVAQHDGNC